MKIVFICKDFYPSLGGGELSTLTLAKILAINHQVSIFFLAQKTPLLQVDGQKITYKSFCIPNLKREQFLRVLSSKFKEALQINKPDLVITYSSISPIVINIACELKIPSILFIRGITEFCPIGFMNIPISSCYQKCHRCSPAISAEIDYHKSFERMIINKKVFPKANLILTVSEFMKGLAARFYHVKSEVVPPLVRLEDYLVERENPIYYLFTNPTRAKGSYILIDIARRLPEKKFLVVGCGTPDILDTLQNISNIEYVPYTEDMKPYYQKTKVCLLPRIWAEPGGRVAIEAMGNGIPCISSYRGGLPEIIGEGGILIREYNDIPQWEKAILQLDQPHSYEHFSEKAKKRAQKLSSNQVFKTFKDIVWNRLQIPL